jgi:cardiolipin synthase A/B
VTRTTLFLTIAIALSWWLFLYLQGVFEPKVEYRSDRRFALDDPNFIPLLMGCCKSLPAQANIVKFWSQPERIYAARLAAISTAQHIIQFETFFMTPGKRTQEFAAALIERSHNGVRVQMLIDHAGTHQLPSSYWNKLRAAGVEVRFFHPPRLKHPLQYLNRTHRKLLIVDGTTAFIGGTGVSDDWDGNPQIGDTAPWLDCEIQLNNAIVPMFSGIFLRHWWYARGRTSGAELPLAPANVPTTPMLVTASDADDNQVSPINALYWFGLQAAQQQIWIASPYFLLDINTRRALIDARQRGVAVRVVTTSARNDKPAVYYAAREGYRELLVAGIEIYEYQPSMMHAKLMLVDRQWINFGSANFDPRSFFHNDELNLAWFDRDFAATLDRFFHDACAQSELVKLSLWMKRPWWQRCLGRLMLVLRWQL